MTKLGQGLPYVFYLLLQQCLTEVTGKAPTSVPPLVTITRPMRQAMTIVSFLLGVTLTCVGLLAGWLLALVLVPAGWLLTAASLRTCQVSLTHYASHGTLWDNQRLNTLMGELYSIIAFSQPLWVYRIGHIYGHHARLGLPADPDAWRYSPLQFDGAETLRACWAILFRYMANPITYVRLFINRVKDNVLIGAERHAMRLSERVPVPSVTYRVVRAMAGVSAQLAALWVAIQLDVLLVYALAYLVPLTFGFGLLSILQNLTEHQPGPVPGQSEDLRGDTVTTGGRFFGREYTGKPMRWVLRLLVVDLPSKLLMVGNTELQSHDLHHDPDEDVFKRSDTEWAMAPYVRADVIATKGYAYKETWGLRSAIEHTFAAHLGD